MKAAVFTVNDFPFDLLQYVLPCPRKRAHPKAHEKTYANIIATFDIETTMLDDIKQGVMWHWQACVDGMVCVGRTWEEYKTFLTGIDANLPQGLCFVQYAHNLSFEWQHLRAIHDFKEDEVFCVTGRKVVKANIGDRFEYRCSFFLTNMSLREFLEKYNVEHKKTELDYRKIRYPWTEITAEELEYCVADVLGLYEALKKMLALDGHTLQTVPMSSTGYVREDFKRAMRKGHFLPLVRQCAPSYDVYLALRRAFRGGNTHCNKLYSGVILPNVSSYDRASSYPDVIVNSPFPIKPFKRVSPCAISDLKVRTPYLIHLRMRHVHLKDPFCGCPYLSIHKLQNKVNVVADNGRLTDCDYCETYLTDIDLQIVLSQYDFNGIILELWESEYGRLPQAMIDVTMDYYRKKTELKGVDGQEVFYMKAKNKLNSIYGMCATNPVRVSMVYNGRDFTAKAGDEIEQLQKANKRSFTVFAWGCW